MLYELRRSDVAVSPGRWEELPTAGRRGPRLRGGRDRGARRGGRDL